MGFAAFALVLILIRDIRQLDAYTYTIGLAGVVLLLLPIVPGVGYAINGARLWAHFGGISFQPAEFGKILIVIFLASYLASKRELLASGMGPLGMPRAKDLGPLVLAWAASLAVLFLERDMGASLLFFGVFVVMIWLASGRPGYLVVGGILFVLGAFIGYLAFAHVQARVEYWLHALDPATVHDIGYGQLAQGWFALASGGLVGTGLGQGSPTLIPYVGSDFIFAAFGEELGMVGAAGLLLLYLVLIGRGLRIGLERVDPFGKLLAAGLTTVLALQTFTIVAGVTRLIPLTGVPLPLVSYGGSSRVATFVILALLVRMSAGPWERSPWIGGSAASASRWSACSRCCSCNSRTCRCSRRDASATTRRTRRARSSPSTRWTAARSCRQTRSSWPRASRRRAGPTTCINVATPTGRCTPASRATTPASTAGASWSRR